MTCTLIEIIPLTCLTLRATVLALIVTVLLERLLSVQYYASILVNPFLLILKNIQLLVYV